MEVEFDVKIAVPAGKSFIESKAAGAHKSGIQAAPSL